MNIKKLFYSTVISCGTLFGIGATVATIFSIKSNNACNNLKIKDGPTRNAIAHAFTSAEFANMFCPEAAHFIGKCHEVVTPYNWFSAPNDKHKDYYNNIVGIKFYEQHKNEYANLKDTTIIRQLSNNSDLITTSHDPKCTVNPYAK